MNIYSRTLHIGAGRNTNMIGISMLFFRGGGPGRTRTCNQTVMSGRL